jgi:hypothetical protein
MQSTVNASYEGSIPSDALLLGLIGPFSTKLGEWYTLKLLEEVF